MTVWKTTDPLGKDVVLKKATYEEHIIKGHTGADASFREKACKKAVHVVRDPSLICEDSPENKDRVNYISLCPIDGAPKIITVVVDMLEEGSPGEVVTVIASKKLSKGGGVLYERT